MSAIRSVDMWVGQGARHGGILNWAQLLSFPLVLFSPNTTSRDNNQQQQVLFPVRRLRRGTWCCRIGPRDAVMGRAPHLGTGPLIGKRVATRLTSHPPSSYRPSPHHGLTSQPHQTTWRADHLPHLPPPSSPPCPPIPQSSPFRLNPPTQSRTSTHSSPRSHPTCPSTPRSGRANSGTNEGEVATRRDGGAGRTHGMWTRGSGKGGKVCEGRTSNWQRMRKKEVRDLPSSGESSDHGTFLGWTKLSK